MTNGSMERVIWLRVAGLLAMGWGYLSMRGRISELGSTYGTLILIGVTLIGTALVAVWRPDQGRRKSIGASAVFVLVFAVYYGSVLYLWESKWGIVPHAAFVLSLLVGPMFIPRRSSP